MACHRDTYRDSAGLITFSPLNRHSLQYALVKLARFIVGRKLGMTIQTPQSATGTPPHAIAQGMFACLLLIMSSAPLCNEAKDPTVLYMDNAGVKFSVMLDRISTSTGYEIELVGAWPDGAVNSKMQGLTLEAGLKLIIKELGVTNHALILDNDAKKIRIVSFQEGHESDDIDKLQSTRITGDASTGIASGAIDDTVSPPSPDGKPGLTRSQVAAIRAEHLTQLLTQTGDTEISPASEYGPGLTIDEFDGIKRTYDDELQSQDGSTPVAPSSEFGNALTARELSRIKSAHEKQSNLQGPQTIVAPPSDAGPGLTLGELNYIKQQHQKRWLSYAKPKIHPANHGPEL